MSLETLLIVAAIPVGIFVLIMFFRLFPLALWISAAASGVRISIFSMIGMRFRRINPSKVVLPMIKATKAGLKVNMNEHQVLNILGIHLFQNHLLDF